MQHDVLAEVLRIRVVAFDVGHVHPVAYGRVMPQVVVVLHAVDHPQAALGEVGQAHGGDASAKNAQIVGVLLVFAVVAGVVHDGLLSVRHFQVAVVPERTENAHREEVCVGLVA